MNWFLVVLVFGFVFLIVVFFIIYKIYLLIVKEILNVKSWVENELVIMGKIVLVEKFMIGIFVIVLILWIVGSFIYIDVILMVFIVLVLLLLIGVLIW